jgi:uncharacterized membrane protein YsdA (DUF1294 family)
LLSASVFRCDWQLLLESSCHVVRAHQCADDGDMARIKWRRERACAESEATLLAFGVTGGWPGAILGQQLFRHKTQKQPFKTYFMLSVILSIAAMAAVYHFSAL